MEKHIIVEEPKINTIVYQLTIKSADRLYFKGDGNSREIYSTADSYHYTDSLDYNEEEIKEILLVKLREEFDEVIKTTKFLVPGLELITFGYSYETEGRLLKVIELKVICQEKGETK